MRIKEICLSLILFQIIAPSTSRGWKGIVPLHSTRTEVEGQLGPPTTSCAQTCAYNMQNESVTIVYSTDPCQTGDNNRWRVPVGTVVTIIVYPSVKPKLKDLKLNHKQFIKSKDPELAGYWRYTSEREGISYEVSNTGRVLSIEWFPTDKEGSLKCDKK